MADPDLQIRMGVGGGGGVIQTLRKGFFDPYGLSLV